jgi:predicted DNA-binding transcriptional regulator AlpA
MPEAKIDSAVVTALERNKLLRSAEVQKLTGIGKTKRAALIRAGKFPHPVQVLNEHGLPSRTNFWTQGDILDYLHAQVDASNKRLAEIAKTGINRYLTQFPVSDKESGGTGISEISEARVTSTPTPDLPFSSKGAQK